MKGMRDGVDRERGSRGHAELNHRSSRYDQRHIDRSYGEGAKHRTRVGAERVLPLLAVFWTFPTRPVRADVRGCALVERARIGGLDKRRSSLLLALGQRVDSVGKQLAAAVRSE